MLKHFLVVILLFPILCFGQGPKPDSLDIYLKSPYQSVYTLLYYLNEEGYNPQKAALPISDADLTEDERIEVANSLKQVLDGEGIYIYMDEVPKNPNYVDSTTNKAQYVLTPRYPNIYLTKRDNKWQFQSRSIDAINIAHESVFKFGTDKLLKILPKVGTKKIMGLAMWQHFGILILAFLSFLIHKIFTLIFEKLILRVLISSGYEKIAAEYILPVARPLSLLFVTMLLVLFVPVLQLPVVSTKYIDPILKALLPLFAVIVFYKMADILALYLQKLASKTESTLDDQLVPLFRKTLKTFIVTIGALFILENLNVPILPLLTGLSIGGLAFALAAQDTIKNFFGSLMIFIDKPFQIGDWITSGDIDGSVEEVGFRSTRVRTFRNSVVYVPNGRLADSTIDNHGLRKYRRFYTQIALTYDTPAELIEIFVEGLKEIVKQHPKTRKDFFEVHFNEMADFSLNIMFYIFFEVPTWSEELRARHEVLIEVVKLAEKLGVNFAFPTQTLHVENLPGQKSLSPSYESRDTLKKKLEAYFSEK
ncbi:mechanosensitive ion channel family protein [Reichenbachiella sp. MALMAid0571]|uniref:mechanosensitive ion channel family protein n=1 Tax=Reichenbachiella sp. MALMAid0571 TaxID=3143939 RepID=UPI0032DFFC75